MIRELLLVRHGESTANVAATAAEAAGSETIDVAERDADVPLSDEGLEQARALGSWVGDLGLGRDAGPHADADAHSDADAGPAGTGTRTAFWCSPYLRARQTIGTALDEAGVDATVRVDERLRDRELGVLDLLTRRGVQALHPDEEARRQRLGKFYHRPPGGESWADVALRVRSLVRELEALPDTDRVVIAAHDAVIMLVVYVCTGLSEADLLEFARSNTVTNASVTTLRHDEGASWWTLDQFADVAHLADEDAPVTTHEGDRDVRPH
jgi:probable phosphoglycerate mutase